MDECCGFVVMRCGGRDWEGMKEEVFIRRPVESFKGMEGGGRGLRGEDNGFV